MPELRYSSRRWGGQDRERRENRPLPLPPGSKAIRDGWTAGAAPSEPEGEHLARGSDRTQVNLCTKIMT